MSIRDFLDKMPTASRVSVFNHERSFGVLIGFAEKGFGFGEITLAVDKATGEARCDLEAMSPGKCGELLMRAVGVPVGDVMADYRREEAEHEAALAAQGAVPPVAPPDPAVATPPTPAIEDARKADHLKDYWFDDAGY